MNPKNLLAHASFTLGTVGLLVLAAASGCGSPPSSAPDTQADAAPWADTDAGDAGSDAAPDPDASALEAGDCPTGTADCDGDPGNGCEARIGTDAKNCGACKHDCTGLPHVSGVTTCAAGKCVVPTTSCAAGFAHCSMNPDDGCEADLSKPTSCGTCGTACSGTTPVCSTGTCSNGCSGTTPTLCSGSCVDTTKSATNCGGCGNACPVPSHGQATCATSACGFSCNSGYHACGMACADNANPLTCGSSCTPCAVPANARATCDGTSCGFACNAGYHKCGSTCSRDDDATACGLSCTVCTVPGGAGHATCSAGSCGIACDSGNHLCGTTCDSNASVATCGSSCTPCAAPASNGRATCDGTSCGIACNPSYHQCGNGCASNTSLSSCGAMCTPCASPPNAQPTCNGLSCGFTCNAGYADCDGNAANGCEAILDSDGNNCKTCGHSCLGGACSAGTCQPLLLASIDAREIAIDTVNIYVGTGDDRLWVAPKAASSGTLSTPCTAGVVNGITFDANYVYFTDTQDEVCWAPKMPGAAPTQRNGQLTGSGTGIVAQNGQLFWGDASNRVIWAEGATIGSPAAVYTAPQLPPYPYSFASDSQSIAWVEYGNLQTSSGGNVKIANVAFSNVLTVAFLQDGPAGVALDSQYIYWTNANEGAVKRALRTGGGVLPAIATQQGYPIGIAVDGSGVYWANNTAGTIVRNGAVIAQGQTQAWRLAVDAAAIYWVNKGIGVMRLAK